MSWFFATNSSISNLFLRVGLGAIMLPHGLQKTLGLFEGPGFMNAMHGLSETIHKQFSAIPSIVCTIMAVLVILAESVGAVALIFGFFTRLAAFGLFLTMAGAIWMKHWPHGFFMDWYSKHTGEGFEYHLLVMLVSFVLIFGGGGLASVDRALSKKGTTAA